MTTKKEQEGKEQQVAPPSQEVKTKSVRNRGTGKVELLIDGEVVVFLPKCTVEVPLNFNVPSGIGLYVV